MYVVILKFLENISHASEYMEAHNQWIKRGFDEGVFLLVGSLKPGLGGTIIAHNTSFPALMDRINEDPFIVEKIVETKILEIDPKQADGRLQFLLS